MRHGGLTLLLLAIAVRAMVPVGWMPSAGSFGLTFCNGDAAMPSFAEIARHRTDGAPFAIAVARAMIDRAEGKGDPAPPPGDPHPCIFAAMAPALPGPTSIAVLPPPAPPTIAMPALAQRTVAVGRGLSAPPPPATGPPLIA